MSLDIAGLLTEDMEKAGRISFQLTDQRIFDEKVKDVTVFYTLVGESRFKFFRSNVFELVFVHLTEDWMRQARVDLKNINCSGGVDVLLTWDEKADTLSVRGIGDKDYIVVTAMQIDS
ncbi:hypothetical protein [Desulfallas thermosapovorans]|uniref:Uncharacterized protein n=1 Tax=Desulfallas thermosapovorans DSM 6562 TaxID=1121431 RepID=A0A5S4ZNZ3_9FIRM|nr:hypothetical protein [Desulfallas thermosapovorans]TYO93358.1 hypothetical protein LX24_02688 [Desulfallas thermosapovorans DSM 6562]